MSKRQLWPIVGCLALSNTAVAEIRFQGFASIVGGFTFDDDPGDQVEEALDMGSVNNISFRNTEYE